MYGKPSFAFTMKTHITMRFSPRDDIIHCHDGFSLIEVTLAMGIISFSLLTILGLMPVGLNTMRQAMDSTQRAQILRRISGEVMVKPWSQIRGTNALDGTKRFFDDEGQEQNISQTNADTRYWVQFSVTNTIFPGSRNADASFVTNSLQTVKVMLISVNAIPSEKTNYFCIPVANAGN